MPLDRFLFAQKLYLEDAKTEIQTGKKKSHWIWFVFPQLKGLGKSQVSKYYGLNGIKEAKEYYNNAQLRKNLLDCFKLVLKLDNLEECFRSDTVKIYSCASIFYLATQKKIFKEVIDKYFGGRIDNNTVLLLG